MTAFFTPTNTLNEVNNIKTFFGPIASTVQPRVNDAVMQRINKVSQFSENWDGYGSLAPDANAVQRARELINLNPVCFNSTRLPEISADEDGRIIIEWRWNSTSKTLALFIGPEDIIVVQSWGPGNPITDTILSAPDKLSEHWGWLFVK